MTRYELLKTIHVLAAVIWVGGAFTFQILATRLVGSGDGHTLGRFSLESEWIGTRFYLPASFVALGTGIWMVIDAWAFEELWIIVGIVGIAYSALNGALVLGPTGKKIGEIITARGPEDPEAQQLTAKIMRLSRIELVVLLLVVVNMVIKPGA